MLEGVILYSGRCKGSRGKVRTRDRVTAGVKSISDFSHLAVNAGSGQGVCARSSMIGERVKIMLAECGKGKNGLKS